VESFEQVRLALRLAAKGAPVRVYGVDILPRMSDYVVPPGVRIADADRIRLGAYLAEGTTVSHEGLVTYNAGTLGAAVIQGRLSEGVVVQAGTTVGGGASIMGTDPGSAHISVGRDCLLGANAGVGISLGDACTVEAGLYVTAGTKVNLVAEGGEMVVPARELAGRSGLLFRRNSVPGAVEAITATGAEAQSDADAQSGTGSGGHAGGRGTSAGVRGTSAGGRGATEPGAGAGDQPQEWLPGGSSAQTAPAARPAHPPGRGTVGQWWICGGALVAGQRGGDHPAVHCRHVRQCVGERSRTSRQRGPDRGDRDRARPSGPGRDYRLGQGDAGIEDPQSRPWRPGLARAVPATSFPGVGQPGGADGPALRHERLLRRTDHHRG